MIYLQNICAFHYATFMFFKRKTEKEEPHFPKVNGHLLEEEEKERVEKNWRLIKFQGKMKKMEMFSFTQSELKNKMRWTKRNTKRKAIKQKLERST